MTEISIRITVEKIETETKNALNTFNSINENLKKEGYIQQGSSINGNNTVLSVTFTKE